MGAPAPGTAGQRNPVRARRRRPVPGRHRRARHEQDPGHRYLPGRSDLPHRHSGARPWHRRGTSPPPKPPNLRTAPTSSSTQPRVKTVANPSEDETRRRRSRQVPCRRSQGTAWQAGRHQGRPPDSAARQRRQAVRRREGAGIRRRRRWPVPYRIPVHRQLRAAERRSSRRRPTPSCSASSRARRSLSARSTPAPTSRCRS